MKFYLVSDEFHTIDKENGVITDVLVYSCPVFVTSDRAEGEDFARVASLHWRKMNSERKYTYHRYVCDYVASKEPSIVKMRKYRLLSELDMLDELHTSDSVSESSDND